MLELSVLGILFSLEAFPTASCLSMFFTLVTSPPETRHCSLVTYSGWAGSPLDHFVQFLSIYSSFVMCIPAGSFFSTWWWTLKEGPVLPVSYFGIIQCAAQLGHWFGYLFLLGKWIKVTYWTEATCLPCVRVCRATSAVVLRNSKRQSPQGNFR